MRSTNNKEGLVNDHRFFTISLIIFSIFLYSIVWFTNIILLIVFTYFILTIYLIRFDKKHMRYV